MYSNIGKARSSLKVNILSHACAMSTKLDENHEIKDGEYGSVTNDIKALVERKRKLLNFTFAPQPQVLESDQQSTPTNIGTEPEQKKARCFSKVNNYSHAFAMSTRLDEGHEIKDGEYGSVTDDIKALWERKRKFLNSFFALQPQVLESDQQSTPLVSQDVSGLKDAVSAQDSPVIIIDSDDEEPVVDLQSKRSEETSCSQKQKLMEGHADGNETKKVGDIYFRKEDENLMEHKHHTGSNIAKIICDKEISDNISTCIGLEDLQKKDGNHQIDLKNIMFVAGNQFEEDDCIAVDTEIENDGILVENVSQLAKLDTSASSDSEEEDAQDDDPIVPDCDDLENIWNEMNFAMECSKETIDTRPEERASEEIRGCDHTFLLKEDLGYVCRVCGVIGRGIETIIEYQYAKSTRSTRTYFREALITNDKQSHKFNDGLKMVGQDIPVEEFNIHPWHMKQMKPHQLEGFKFLQSNLVTDNPGGCILAHAPGSGKTFMIISFMQSFLAKYPEAKPLVVLPKGIITTWKKEFNRWQVEDIPLYDFYSTKADNRVQQLEVLKQWTGQRSILFLGYNQFSKIVCDNEPNETTSSCQKILTQRPSILILDEGHTPRNEATDVLNSLRRVQTTRKVVLSGTLFQNHVEEVFNIFDLVRPKFLRQENPRAIIRRILSRVSSPKKHDNLENAFYNTVESTLLKDDVFKRKISVIQDLREMTSKVLHFYKGDFLDELPGILDFTVFLNLSHKQIEGVKELKRLNQNFKVISEGSALYVHPNLRNQLKSTSKRKREGPDEKMDRVIEKSEISDGVKTQFFLNLLGLCESTGEKLLVFSQFIQPLKFLKRLVVKIKGWCLGKEIFVITGDSSSESRDTSMEQFNKSSSARVFFGSIKACGEGISLVGASRIIILDVHLNPSVTRQAVGRAFRPGQKRKVYVYRLVAAESPEEDDHSTCFRKESIAKMWFEWNECCGEREFEMHSVDVRECGDKFLESSKLSVDIKSLCQR